jgi:hypothetical protein
MSKASWNLRAQLIGGALLLSVSTAAAAPSGWWNLNWRHSKWITVTTGSATLPAGYTVPLTFDHAALVTAGKSLANGNDVRVAYWNGSTWTELDRILDPGSAWNSATTTIWLKLQAGIPASSADDNYGLYYGNSTAGAPPVTGNNVFLHYDGFESGNLSGWGSVWQDPGDTIVASTATVRTGTYAGQATINASNPGQASVRAEYAAQPGVHAVVYARFPAGYAFNADTSIQQLYGGFWGEQQLTLNVQGGTRQVFLWNNVSGQPYFGTTVVNTGQWYRLELKSIVSPTAGRAELWVNGVREANVSNQNTGSVNVDNNLAGIYWKNSGPNTLTIDDAFTRMWVDPEPATAAGTENTCCSSLVTTTGAGTVTVTAPSWFEMRFNTATGGSIDQFFDLAEDPTRTVDLGGGTQGIETLLSDAIESGGVAIWYDNAQNPSETMVPGSLPRTDVLEVTSARVRVRAEAFYHLEGGGTTILPGIKSWSDYSVYSTGRIAYRLDRRTFAPVNYSRNSLSLGVHLAGPPLASWNAYSQSGALGNRPASDTFGLFRSDVAGARTDFLMIPHRDWTIATGHSAAATEWARFDSPPEEYGLISWREFTGGTYPAGTRESWDFLTYFKPTNFGDQTDPAVASRRTDYRGPDPLSAIGPGNGWNENPADADFFNESEAVYTLDLNPSTGLTFDMNGSVTTRYSPFFKIRQWRSLTTPATITVEGVTKNRDVDFRADVKPVSRAFFAKDVLWHSTLQVALAVTTNVDIGSPGVSNGVSYVAARYGQGANITANNQYISFPVTDGSGALTGNLGTNKGAVEFWYRPSWNHNDFLQHDLGGVYVDANTHSLFQKLANNDLRFRLRSAGISYDCTVPAGNYGWRALDWVHLRFEWDDSPFVGPEQRILINGSLPTQNCPSDWTAGGLLGPNVHFLLGDIADGAGTFGAGTYDEFYSFGVSSTTPAALANGGHAASANEYLATGARNYQLAFVTRDASFRGPRFYVGSDSKFLGLNVALAVKALSPDANLRIHYWNGMQWSYLSDTDSAFWAPGFSDTTNSLRQDGTMSWTEALVPNWAPYSVNGGPDLYYIRIGQQFGTYTTPPTEGVIKTDILLFQYCADVTLAAQTFAFSVPPPTAVELSAFEAHGLDGAVSLTWRTASELKNLGFHLSRATAEEGPYERVTTSPIPGLGSSPSGASYRYTDAPLVNGTTYFYQLEDIETTGKTEIHGPIRAVPREGAVPSEETEPGSALTYGTPGSSTLRVLARNAREIVVELTTGGFRAEPEADGSVRLSIPGFADESEPGSPLLPVKRSWIGLDGARAVELTTVTEDDVETFSSLRPVAADSPELIASARGTVRAGRRAQRKGRAFRGEGLHPEAAARLLEVGFQGEEKKARIELAPLRWNRSTGELVLARRLVVRITLSGREPKEGRRERAPRPPEVARRLRTDAAGLYRVTYEDLFGRSRRRGSALSVRLSRLGEAVPFHVEPAGEGFGPGSTLYFPSDGAQSNPFGDRAVYELEVNQPGTRIPLAPEPPSGSPVAYYWREAKREENRYYQAGLIDADDLWLWDVLLAPSSKSYPFDVSALAATTEPAQLSVRLQGTSDLPESPDHHVRVSVNGALLLDETFEGKDALPLAAEIPPGTLVEGVNELSIENVGDTGAAYSMVMLDRFSVWYPRRLVGEAGRLEGTFSATGVAEVEGLGEGVFVLDVTEEPSRWLPPSTRFRVEAGRRYHMVASSAVLAPEVETVPTPKLARAHGADYVVLGPRVLLHEAAPLLKLRESQGLRSRAVAIEDVYSEFGFGEERPDAIRKFLTHAYHHWREPSLRYVLLLGDATYDFEDYLGTGVKNQVPPAMVRTSYLWTASDASYAAVHGSDDLPDLAVGRLPAATAEEARVMISKVLAYETKGYLSRGAVVLVADDSDAAGDFERDAEELASGLLSARNPRKIFLGRLGTEETRAEIAGAFDDGASLVSYLGHGGIHLWASENVFDTSRVDTLAPAAQLPLLLTLNCLNGYFHFPYFDSLAEALVKAEDKGAIAAFSPSGLSLNGPAHLYHQALLRELLSGCHARLGDAVLAAQTVYADSGAFPELLRIYNLLGDPALSLR